MSKWKIRTPEMYQNIPEGGYAPRPGIAILVALLLYLIYTVMSVIPQGVQAVLWFAPRIGAGQSIFDLMEGYMNEPSTLLTALYGGALLILVTAFYIRRIEKRPLSTIGLSRKGIPLRYLLGFGIGVLMMALTSWPAFALEEVVWKGFTPLVALFFGAFLIQGASEEVLFRGMLLSSMSRKTGVFTAVMLSSALFAAMHLASFEGLLYLLTLFGLGALMAVVTIRTNSLWAACGLHTAWNFVSGLLASGEAGGIGMDYSVVTIGDPNAPLPDFGFIGNPFYLYYIAVFAAAIAVVIFAGKNKLAVLRPEGELSLAGARSIAKTALPKPALDYANIIVGMVRSDDEKAAALLCLAAERGVPPYAMAENGVGRHAGLAALALARRPGESEQARWERVQADPVAVPVFQAQARYAADYAAQQAAVQWHAQMAQYNQAMAVQQGNWLAGYTGQMPQPNTEEAKQTELSAEPQPQPEKKDEDTAGY